MPRMGEQRYQLDGSTLSELRDIVAATADLPATSTIRVTTRRRLHTQGSKVRTVHVDPDNSKL